MKTTPTSTSSTCIKDTTKKQDSSKAPPSTDEIVRFFGTSATVLIVPLLPVWALTGAPNLLEIMLSGALSISLAFLIVSCLKT